VKSEIKIEEESEPTCETVAHPVTSLANNDDEIG
jgi:hypothetical protein